LFLNATVITTPQYKPKDLGSAEWAGIVVTQRNVLNPGDSGFRLDGTLKLKLHHHNA
jgi:hypothetical protein